MSSTPFSPTSRPLAAARLKSWYLPVAAVLSGLVLRLLWLGHKSLWLDEARSLIFAQSGGAQIWAGTGEQYHPPLYYMLLHYWIRLGTAESTLRLSSALVDTVTICLIFALAHRLMGRAAALSAAWLAALSPLLVWYAQELRSYSLLTLLGLVTALAVVHLTTRRWWAWWLVFVAAMAAALYTHYNAVLLIPVHLILLLFAPVPGAARRRTVWAWLAAWPLVGLIYWPWLASPGAAAFVNLLVGGRLYPAELLAARTGLSTGAATLVIAVTLLALGGLALAAALLIRRHGARGWQRLTETAWVRGALIAIFVLAAAIIVVPRGYAAKRLAVVIWPYALLVWAWVFPWSMRTRRALAALLLTSLAAAVVNITLIPKDNWRDLVAEIVAHHQPGDVVWIQPGWQNAPFNYYRPAAVDLPVQTAPQNADRLAEAIQAHTRIWHVYQTYDLPRIDPDRIVERGLQAQLEPLTSFDFYRVHATLYQRAAPE